MEMDLSLLAQITWQGSGRLFQLNVLAEKYGSLPQNMAYIGIGSKTLEKIVYFVVLGGRCYKCQLNHVGGGTLSSTSWKIVHQMGLC